MWSNPLRLQSVSSFNNLALWFVEEMSAALRVKFGDRVRRLRKTQGLTQ
jgi:hypothetical protein